MKENFELKKRLDAAGRVPVFPLADVVFFPDTVLPLHIFEPRYRRMTEDALRSHRFIAMAALKPGWERDYEGTPEVYATACAGVIEDDVRLPDGRFNIRLRGVARVRIREFVQDHPYRIATIQVLDEHDDTGASDVEAEKRHLLVTCAGLMQETTGEKARPVSFEQEVPFSVVVNTLSQNLDIDPAVKQRLLEMDDLRARARALGEILEQRWRETALARSAGGADPDRVH